MVNKINFGKFKKESSDGENTTFRHPDGHSIVVSHKALSPKMRSQLAELPVKNMADGGEAEAPVPSDEDGPSEYIVGMRAAHQGLAKGEYKGHDSITKSQQTANYVPPAAPPKQETHQEKMAGLQKGAGFAKGGKVQNFADGTPDDTVQSSLDNADAANPEPEAAAAPAPQQAPVVVNNFTGQPPQGGQPSPQQPAAPGQGSGGAMSQGNGLFDFSGPKPPGAMGPTVPPAGAPNPFDPDQAAAPTPETQPAEAPKTSADFAGAGALAAGTEHGLEMEQAGAENSGAAAQRLGTAQAAIQHQQASANQAIADQYNMHVKDTADTYATTLKAIQAQKTIDPDETAKKVWDQKSTVGKIASIIGLIAGGGLGPARRQLDFEIARDIDAQKAELGKKQNLLTATMQHYGNESDAARMAAALQYGVVAAQMGEAAAKESGPLAKAALLMGQGKLYREEVTPRMQMVAMSQTMRGGLDDGHLDQHLQTLQFANPTLYKEIQPLVVPGLGKNGGSALAKIPVPEAARKEMIGSQDLDNKIAELQRFAKEHQGSWNPQTINQGEGLVMAVQDATRRAKGEGVFKEGEMHWNQKVYPSPTGYFNSIISGPKYQAARKSNLDSLNALKIGYGLPVPKTIETVAPVAPK